MTGKKLTAKQAHRLNLVNKLVPYEERMLELMERMAIDAVCQLYDGSMSYPRMSLYDCK